MIFGKIERRWRGNMILPEIKEWLAQNGGEAWDKEQSFDTVERDPKEHCDCTGRRMTPFDGNWIMIFVATYHQKACRLREIIAAINKRKIEWPHPERIGFFKKDLVAIAGLFEIKVTPNLSRLEIIEAIAKLP